MALLALLTSGCFLDHGSDPDTDAGPRPTPIPDAGPTPDAGPAPACFDADGDVSFACPGAIYSVGDYVNVGVFHGYGGGCCGGGTGTLDLANDEPGEWTVRSRWTDICDCCAECECVGPATETTIAIGPLVEGENRVFDPSSGVSCSLYAQDLSSCEPAPGDAVAARVLFPDQTDDVTLAHVASADCSCDPRVRARPDEVSLELCECQSICDDVLTPYRAHHVGETRPQGEYPRALGGSPATLTVLERALCAPWEATGLEVVTPEPGDLGPPLVWVGVAGAQGLCCVEPMPAASHALSDDGAIEVQLYSCVREDCFCAPAELTPFTAWHSLGPLAPGEYTVRAGEHAARFVVP